MPSCLLVDDDDIRTLVGGYLQRFDIEVEAVGDGTAMRDALARRRPDVLLLDLMLPGESGLDLCRWVRAHDPGLPVLMLTAQGDPISRVLGLELGADDYIAKPFEPRELVARINAVLRRATVRGPGDPASPMVRFDGWTLDTLQRHLTSPAGVLTALSNAEFKLLKAFVERPMRVLSRADLLDLTGASDITDRSIDLAVSRLRAKLGGEALIRTVRGAGYSFNARSTR